MKSARVLVIAGAGAALQWALPLATGAGATYPVNCQATNSQYAQSQLAKQASCSFTTKDPIKAAAQGVTSAYTGDFTIFTKQKGCLIVFVSATGGMTEQKQSFTSSGAQATTLNYSNHCTYTLVLHPDGTGSATAGQTN